MNERDRLIIKKIITYCDEIHNTHDFFKNDRELFFDKKNGFIYRNSVTMPVLQIGELAKNLSDEFRDSNKEIPWREIIGMRDIFAHHYGSLDYEIAWNTSKDDIEALKTSLEEI